tara:strand:- start:972 stop:2174 length:1203 start_codon:yes stop_codon:yes gene_type:complete
MNISTNDNSYNDNNMNINNLVSIHYNSNTKHIFDFLAEFMTNKFYNVCFELATKYSLNNGLSLSNNYKNILDSYMDTLIINNVDEEAQKNKMFGVFLNHLYDSYVKYVKNNIITINDFLIIINKTFLPDNYKEDIYIKNQKNLSILFHSLIFNLSKYIYDYLLNNFNIILRDRIHENAFILKKECINFLSIIRSDLFINFNKLDNMENTDALIENDIVINNKLYIDLLLNYNEIKEEYSKMKLLIIKLVKKENIYKDKIQQLFKLIIILNNKLIQKNSIGLNDNTIDNHINTSEIGEISIPMVNFNKDISSSNSNPINDQKNNMNINSVLFNDNNGTNSPTHTNPSQTLPDNYKNMNIITGENNDNDSLISNNNINNKHNNIEIFNASQKLDDLFSDIIN